MSSTTSTVKLKINGKDYSVDSPKKYTTLNQFIRAQPNLKGTKHNCGEAGCGACVVVLTRSDPNGGATISTSVNSCVRPLASCHGMEVTTVEGIGSSDKPHPIQQSFADNDASQCGFCTDGMIMSTYGTLQQNPQATKRDLVEGIDGNLCRCTGYAPIVKAVTSFGSDFVEQDLKKCCSSQKRTFTDIEEIGTVCGASKGYCHSRSVFTAVDASPSLKFDGWVTVTTLAELSDALASAPVGYRLVAGNTASGIYPHPIPSLYINIAPIADLRGINADANSVTYGALTTIAELQNSFASYNDARFQEIAQFIKRIASAPIRNVGTVVGNLMMAHEKNFISDVYVSLAACGTTVKLVDGTSVSLGDDFINLDMSKKVIASFSVPFSDAGDIFVVRKAALRQRLSHSYVNVAFSAKMSGSMCTSATLFMGGLPGAPRPMTNTVAAFVGQDVSQHSTLESALSALSTDLGTLPSNDTGGQFQYRRNLAASFVYKLALAMNPSTSAPLKSGVTPYKRPVSSSHATYENPGDSSELPVSAAVPKLKELQQCTGETVYAGDEPILPSTLYCAPVITKGVGDILNVDPSGALSLPGVVDFIGPSDLSSPDFKWGFFLQDFPLFATKRSEFSGQMVGMVVAETQLTAEMGANLVNVRVQADPSIILTIDEALSAKSFRPNPIPSYPQSAGDLKQGFAEADTIITGTTDTSGQLQFPMEPITVYAIPEEGKRMRVIGTFQHMTASQTTIAGAMGVPLGQVTVETRRLGGAFGVKITSPSAFAAAAAVASRKVGAPVKCTLSIQRMSILCGGRNPVRAEYKVGFKNDGTIVAADVKISLLSGAYMDADLFTCNEVVNSITNSYNFQNVSCDAQMVQANLPPFTSARGPGWSQGIFLCESIIEDVASRLALSPNDVRVKNLYKKGETTPYGMPIYIDLASLVDQLKESSNYNNRVSEISQFNSDNTWKKRGISVVPIRFNVRNSGLPMTCAITCFADGSVVVETGGIEMGQGLHTKVAQSVAMTLKISMDLITVKKSTSFQSANSFATGGSIGTDLSVTAAMDAANQLGSRLAAVRVKNPKINSWQELCAAAAKSNVDLRAQGWANIAAPKTPDAYNTYGCVVVEVLLDLLTGEHFILQSDIVMDLGVSMNPLLDVGQINGAYIMGVGLNTCEDVIWDKNKSGRLFSRSTWEYKPPGVQEIPVLSSVSLLKNNPNPRGVLRSKVVAEPPLLMGCAVLYAIRDAIKAAAPSPVLQAPLIQPATVYNILNCLVANKVSSTDKFKM